MIYKAIFPGSFDFGAGEPLAQLITDPRDGLQKRASHGFDMRPEDMRPPPGYAAVVQVALGTYERYGLNRNWDGFPKEACEAYHPTFVRAGLMYRNHDNKDPKKSIGLIKAAAFDPRMDWIKLLLFIDEKKASDELTRLERDGELPGSMSCRVPWDRCTKCNTLRRGKKDRNQCGHVKEALGRMLDDGHVVGTLNDHPRFSEYSIVNRPADRVAWTLEVMDKAAAEGRAVDGAELFELLGYTVDDRPANEKTAAARKLAHYANKLAAFAALEALPVSADDILAWESRKAACAEISDADMASLREYEPSVALPALAAAGVVMSPREFRKYAYGNDGGDAEAAIAAAARAVRDEAAMVKAAGSGMFDADGVSHPLLKRPGASLIARLSRSAGCSGFELDEKLAAAEENVNVVVDNADPLVFTTNEPAAAFGDKYAAYLISAAVSAGRDTDRSLVSAAAAARAVAKVKKSAQPLS